MNIRIRKIAIVLAVVAGLSSAAAAADQGHRGYLGVTAVGIRENTVGENGVFITAVHGDTGAATAGLQEHDRIVEVDGVTITSMDDLDGVLEGTRPGDSVWVRIARESGEQTVNVTLGVKPTGNVHLDGGHNRWVVELVGGAARLGLRGQALNPQLARYFDVEAGVLVTEVFAGSAAATAGIQAGDVLVEIDGHPVIATEDIARRLHHSTPGELLQATVQRRGLQEVFTLEAPDLSSASLTADSINVKLSEVTVEDVGAGQHGEATANVVVELLGAPSEHELRSLEATEHDRAALEHRIHELELHLEHLRRQLAAQDD